MRKIVILDGYTLFNTDLSFDALNDYGEVEFYERTPADLTATRIGNAEIVLTNKTVIDKKVIDECPSLKFISVLARSPIVFILSKANFFSVDFPIISISLTGRDHTFCL